MVTVTPADFRLDTYTDEHGVHMRVLGFHFCCAKMRGASLHKQTLYEASKVEDCPIVWTLIYLEAMGSIPTGFALKIYVGQEVLHGNRALLKSSDTLVPELQVCDEIRTEVHYKLYQEIDPKPRPLDFVIEFNDDVNFKEDPNAFNEDSDDDLSVSDVPNAFKRNEAGDGNDSHDEQVKANILELSKRKKTLDRALAVHHLREKLRAKEGAADPSLAAMNGSMLMPMFCGSMNPRSQATLNHGIFCMFEVRNAVYMLRDFLNRCGFHPIRTHCFRKDNFTNKRHGSAVPEHVDDANAFNTFETRKRN